MTATPPRGGRPTKRTEERETLILRVLHAGGRSPGRLAMPRSARVSCTGG